MTEAFQTPILDLASCADTVYNVHKAGDAGNQDACTPGLGWMEIRDLRTEDTKSGFLGCVYKNTVDGVVVVAFRGTVMGSRTKGHGAAWKNIKTDVGLWAKSVAPNCTDIAMETIGKAQKVRSAEQGIILTGHSLGGAIAVITAVLTGKPACTFNAPSVSKVLSGTCFGGVTVKVSNAMRNFSEDRILNFNVRFDPVSKSSTATGRVVKLPSVGFVGSQHGQGTVIKALEKTTWGKKPFDRALADAGGSL